MPFRPVLRLVSKAWRRRRIAQLLDDLQLWEVDGRNLLAELIELTDQGDDLHAAAVRLRDALEG